MKHTIKELQQRQQLPLKAKIELTNDLIAEWIKEYGMDGVFVSFSGGKDSTVLLDICRKTYPDIKAVFFDTGLEFPEIRQFVKTWEKVDFVRPSTNFKHVISKYGYPFISKEVSKEVYGARSYLAKIPHVNSVDVQSEEQREALRKLSDYCGGVCRNVYRAPKILTRQLKMLQFKRCLAFYVPKD